MIDLQTSSLMKKQVSTTKSAGVVKRSTVDKVSENTSIPKDSSDIRSPGNCFVVANYPELSTYTNICKPRLFTL
jgi:hypothetical protein